jgi:D-xylose 1-dehydrogenase (NADP+, D-xylono-1,5-lactone-forming)
VLPIKTDKYAEWLTPYPESCTITRAFMEFTTIGGTMIRWGVISTAKIGREQVIPAIQASHNGRVEAIASRDYQKARETADKLGIERAYGGYEELLADPNIDAIYNPLPNDGHAPWTIAALRAGKHVLCEKPFAMNAAETQQMVDAAKESGKYLLEAFMYRYHPQHARAKALIDDGEIGVPNLIEVSFTYALGWDVTENVRLKPELGGGGLWDVGCYCVNSIRLMSGQEPLQVSGFAVYGKESGVDETFVGIMQFPSGLLAHFDCGMRSVSRQRYTVIGDKGRVIVHAPFRPDQAAPVVELIKSGGTSEKIDVPNVNQYVLMVEDFADAILNNRPPRFSAEDGLRNMRVLDALALSAHESQVVFL